MHSALLCINVPLHGTRHENKYLSGKAYVIYLLTPFKIHVCFAMVSCALVIERLFFFWPGPSISAWPIPLLLIRILSARVVIAAPMRSAMISRRGSLRLPSSIRYLSLRATTTLGPLRVHTETPPVHFPAINYRRGPRLIGVNHESSIFPISLYIANFNGIILGMHVH